MRFKLIYFLVFLTLSPQAILAQIPPSPFYGVIYDSETAKPVPDVIVTHLETGNTVLSDDRGNFSLTAQKGDRILIEHLAYEPLNWELQKQRSSIYLVAHQQLMETLVICKNNNINDIDMRKLTGSIVTIDMGPLSQRSEIDMMRLLQGQVPGLTIRNSGDLGSKPEIRIRGNQSFSYRGDANEPLFVLDGVLIGSETFLTLNPSDFKEIKVLKDAAAAALYGIKAANGVIEMTSKRGFDGKPLINFSLKQGVTLRGERSVQMMNSAEKLELERKIQNPATPGYFYSPEYIRSQNSTAPNLEQLIAQGQNSLDSLRIINTDWFKELIRPNLFNSYNLSIRGGSAKSTYYYSLNYSNQGGRVPGNDLKTFSARGNLDYILSPNFSISLNNSFGLSINTSQSGGADDPTSLVYNLNPYEQKTSLLHNRKIHLYSYPNQTYEDLIDQQMTKSSSKRLNSSAVIRWQLHPDLEISAVIGGDYNLLETTKRIPPSAYSQVEIPLLERGEFNHSKGNHFDFTTNIRANYQKIIGHHDLFLGLNTDYYKSNKDQIGLIGYGIPENLQTAAGINQSLSGNRKLKSTYSNTKEGQLGIGAALAYSYKNTYDFYSSIKQDASSLLPADKRWNSAWSGGLGWTVSQYAFLKDSRVLSKLKLRSTMGYTASMAEINGSDVHSTYAYSQLVYGDGRLLELTKLPNPNLKPQQTHSYNTALEILLWDRLNLQANYYRNKTVQALLDMPIATSNGFNTLKQNIGELENKGWEFQISGDLIRNANFRWNSSLSLSTNKNKVLQLYGRDQIFLNDKSLLPDYETGQPLGVIYGLESLGVYPLDGIPRYLSPGGRELTYRDQLTRADFSRLGYSIAPYTGFFNHFISYKNLSLSADISYHFGALQSYSTTYVRDSDNINRNAIRGQGENMWFAAGDEDKTYPAAKMDSSIHAFLVHPATNTLYRSDYVKLNFIQLNYGLHLNSQSSLGAYFSHLSFALQADNVYTFRFERDLGSLNNITQPIITLGINAIF